MKKNLHIPGLIDPHVHLRDPGATLENLEGKRQSAVAQIVCDVGFHFGATNDNFPEYSKIVDKVKGLKIYLDSTHGPLLVDTLEGLLNCYRHWQGQQPILVHAEDLSVAKVIGLVAIFKRPTHFCHISLASEIELIKKAKSQRLPITCEVTPHHLFLTEDDARILGPLGLMKPPLRTSKDVDALWKNLEAIDVIASDHAPHTLEEKQSEHPPFGVPGLETTLPLMLTAVAEGRLTLAHFIQLISTNPARIFGIQKPRGTVVEVDVEESYVIKNENLQTKCGWTPFDGRKVTARVRRVFLRGEKVFEDGKILAQKGSGKVLP